MPEDRLGAARRSTSQSSMQSAPRSIAWISESTLRPGRQAPGRPASLTAASTSASIPSRYGSLADDQRARRP
jgi:hypothetical protein